MCRRLSDDGDPGIMGEALKQRDQELKTSGPVTDQEHHADQVEDLHEDSH